MKEETCDHPTNLRMGTQMLNEAEVKTILAMASNGSSRASIVREIGCSRPMVDRYLVLIRESGCEFFRMFFVRHPETLYL